MLVYCSSVHVGVLQWCVYIYCIVHSLYLGLGSLHEAIYRAAISARDPDTKEKVIGQQVCVCACVCVWGGDKLHP